MKKQLNKITIVLTTVIILQFIIIISMNRELKSLTIAEQTQNNQILDDDIKINELNTQTPQNQLTPTPDSYDSIFDYQDVSDESTSNTSSNTSNKETDSSLSSGTYTLTQSTYYCPEDIPAGTYKLKCIDGSTTITRIQPSERYANGYITVISLDASDSNSKEYKNYEVASGDKIRVDFSSKIIFKKQ